MSFRANYSRVRSGSYVAASIADNPERHEYELYLAMGGPELFSAELRAAFRSLRPTH